MSQFNTEAAAQECYDKVAMSAMSQSSPHAETARAWYRAADALLDLRFNQRFSSPSSLGEAAAREKDLALATANEAAAWAELVRAAGR